MDTIESAIHHFQQGNMIVVVDDESRENEGDLICPASTVTPEQINFMSKFARGLICLALPSERVNQLNLPMMSMDNKEGDTFGTAFTFSIDAKEGISTGISACDRALTIRLAVDSVSTMDDLVIPGHIFPLKARKGGVLERRGHTEAAVELTKLAGLPGGGVICEILKEDGTMMRFPDLEVFAKSHGLPLISIHDLVNYSMDKQIMGICQTQLPTPWGTFKQRIYHDQRGGEHTLLWQGDIETSPHPLVRIHSECLTGDIFSSLRCDCGPQLKESLKMMHQEGEGVLIYLRQEGRGIGLTEKIKSYELQDLGLDTAEANQALGHPIDGRTYEVALKMLADLHLSKIRLLTNNPHKLAFLKHHLIDVERVPLHVGSSHHNHRYQQTKIEKFGHFSKEK